MDPFQQSPEEDLEDQVVEFIAVAFLNFIKSANQEEGNKNGS